MRLPCLNQPEPVGSYEGYNLVRHRGSVYGVPRTAGWVDLDLEGDCRRAGVISGDTCEEVQERIGGAREAVPVEFAGWLPIYQFSGNCGRHPQFRHTADPPPGYRFTYSGPPESLDLPTPPGIIDQLLARVGRGVQYLGRMVRPLFGFFRGGPGVGWPARFRVLRALFRLFLQLLRGGARLGPVLRFLQSRHFQSQLQMAQFRGLVFLPSMPYTYGQNPWVVEIEDPTTLFYPLIENGQTRTMRMADSPYFPVIKTLLESDQCKGILTHMKSTAAMVPALFGSETIRKKVLYTPLGVRLPKRWQHHDDEAEPLHLLFINSWCQIPENFYVRGGLDVLEAFAVLHERYPQLRLTLRTGLPKLEPRYHRIIEAGWVRVISRFQSAGEMEALHAGSHIFLLPAARVHIVSLLQAMSYGLAVVTSDGWGIEEYVNNDRNGLIVRGRYGKTSWVDEKEGMLRENYESMYKPDPRVVDGIVEAVSRLVEDRALRKRLGRTARQDVQANYSLERWNRGLKEVFDRALSLPV